MTRPIDFLDEYYTKQDKVVFREWLVKYGARTWIENDRIADKAEEIYGKRIRQLQEKVNAMKPADPDQPPTRDKLNGTKKEFRKWLVTFGASEWPVNDRIADKAAELYGVIATDLERQLAEEKAETERLALKLKAVEHFKANYDEMDVAIKKLEQQLTAAQEARIKELENK